MASLGRIASGMAHEIRNPLTGITSYLYTLEQLCESKTLLPKDIALMKEIVGQLKLASHKVDAVITDPDKPGDWTQQASLEYEIIDFPLHQDSWYFVNTRVVVDSQHEGGVTNTINDNGDINYPG